MQPEQGGDSSRDCQSEPQALVETSLDLAGCVDQRLELLPALAQRRLCRAARRLLLLRRRKAPPEQGDLCV